MGKCGSVAVNFPAERANVGWRWRIEVDGLHAVSLPFYRYQATYFGINLGLHGVCGQADFLQKRVVRLDYLLGVILL